MTYDKDNFYLYFDAPKNEPVKVTFEFKLLYPNTAFSISPDGKVTLIGGATTHQSFFGEKITAEINKYTVKTEEVGDRIKYFVSADREKCGWTEDKPMKLSVRIGKFATPENLWRANGEIEGFLGKNEIAPGEFGWVIPEHLVK